MLCDTETTLLIIYGSITAVAADICSNPYGTYYKECSFLESCCGDRCCSNKVKVVGVICVVIAVLLVMCRYFCSRHCHLFGGANDRVFTAEAISPPAVYGIQTIQTHHPEHNIQNSNYTLQPGLPPMYPVYPVFEHQSVPTAQHISIVPDTPPPAYSDVVSAPPQYSVAVSNMHPVTGEVKTGS